MREPTVAFTAITLVLNGSPARRALFIAVLAALSGLLSNYGNDAFGDLTVLGVPPLPAIYFGIVLAIAYRMWTGAGQLATLAIFGAIKRNSCSIKPVKCAPVILALGEDRVPRKPGLRAFQDEELEELAVVPDRHAPLLVVVGDGERIARPGAAALHAVGTLRAKPSNRSSIRSRQEQSGSSGPSTSCGLITRAHWNTENRM